jgi:hypothetical protein
MIKTYDAKQISIIVGTRPLTGLADGSFVTVRRNEDGWNLQIGSDGEGVRSKTNNRSGQIEINTQQGSSDNDFMSELAISDEVSNGGVVPVLIKDNLGTSLYAAESAWIKKIPDSEFAKETGARTWLMETAQLNMFVGASNSE